MIVFRFVGAVGFLIRYSNGLECHNSKFVIFQEKRLKVLKCYNFL